MYNKQFQQLNEPLHADEALIRDTLQRAERRLSHQRSQGWRMAAVMAGVLFLVVAVAFFTQPAPEDVVASNGALPGPTEALSPLKSESTHSCDVREMELKILASNLRDGILCLEVDLLGAEIHDYMVVTWRLYNGVQSSAFHLHWDENAILNHGQGRITFPVSFAVAWDGECGGTLHGQDALSVSPGQTLTLAVNNYDCSLNHDLYPHWAPDTPWETVLPDCLTLTFTLAKDGSVILPPDAPAE